MVISHLAFNQELASLQKFKINGLVRFGDAKSVVVGALGTPNSEKVEFNEIDEIDVLVLNYGNSKIYLEQDKMVSFELGGFVTIGDKEKEEDKIYELKEDFTGGFYPLSILVKVKFPVEPEEEEVSVSSRARRVQSRLQDLENLALDQPLTDDEKHQVRKKILNDM